MFLTNYFTKLYFVSFWSSEKRNLGGSWFHISFIGNLEIIILRILHYYAKKCLHVYYSATYETKHLLYSCIRTFIYFKYKFIDFVNQIVNKIYSQTLDYWNYEILVDFSFFPIIKITGTKTDSFTMMDWVLPVDSMLGTY